MQLILLLVLYLVLAIVYKCPFLAIFLLYYLDILVFLLYSSHHILHKEQKYINYFKFTLDLFVEI
jgi:hypothetical protein